MRRAKLLAEFLNEHGIKCSLSENLTALPEPGELRHNGGQPLRRDRVPGHAPGRADGHADSRQRLQKAEARARKRKLSNAERIGSYTDLAVGDLVVHEHHGIGRFAGVVRMPVDGAEKDYIKICYAGSDTLYVPATQLDLVSKYIGAGEDRPVRLSKMGGAEWQRTKSRAKAAAKKLAGSSQRSTPSARA